MKFITIAAVSLNNVIGLNNNIPWKYSEDLKFFQDKTEYSPVIMGKNTFISINKIPLKKRLNFVLSSNINKQKGFVFIKSIKNFLDIAERWRFSKVYVLGGELVYNQMLHYSNELIITKIPELVEGDRFFPEIESSIWNLTKVETINRVKINFYKRKNGK